MSSSLTSTRGSVSLVRPNRLKNRTHFTLVQIMRVHQAGPGGRGRRESQPIRLPHAEGDRGRLEINRFPKEGQMFKQLGTRDAEVRDGAHPPLMRSLLLATTLLLTGLAPAYGNIVGFSFSGT